MNYMVRVTDTNAYDLHSMRGKRKNVWAKLHRTSAHHHREALASKQPSNRRRQCVSATRTSGAMTHDLARMSVLETMLQADPLPAYSALYGTGLCELRLTTLHRASCFLFGLVGGC